MDCYQGITVHMKDKIWTFLCCSISRVSTCHILHKRHTVQLTSPQVLLNTHSLRLIHCKFFVDRHYCARGASTANKEINFTTKTVTITISKMMKNPLQFYRGETIIPATGFLLIQKNQGL